MITVLNLIWLLTAVSSVVAAFVSEHARRGTSGPGGQRLLSVLLVMVSLFPCVSASDDVISFAYVSAGFETRSGFGHSGPENSDSDTVIYLVLQNLEHLQVTAFYTLFVAFLFFGLVSISTPRSVLRQVPAFVSRGPPESACPQ